ncbi:MAG: hypothetical protein A2038_05725 [Deltaproteobacteria bacterium GWA2_57_13]|nr:MAG: hypothetical protein A2038_05725 [Deltaproteobacteria bacterium GWA2_57_13]
MAGFLGEKEVLTRNRVKEILANKEYSFLEQKVALLDIEGDNLILKITFLLEYRKRMISIEEKDRIVLAFSEFKIEDWGDGVRKIGDIE